MKKNQEDIQKKRIWTLRILQVILGVCILCMLFIFFFPFPSRNKQSDNNSKKDDTLSSVEIKETETVTPTAPATVSETVLSEPVLSNETSLLSESLPSSQAEFAANTTMAAVKLFDLERFLEEKVIDYQGNWSIYVKNLETGEFAEYDNHQMYAASLIKLYILATFLEEAEAGRVERTDTTDEYLRKMIAISDNDATNDVVRLIGHGDSDRGREIINAFCAKNNYIYTSDNRDLGVPPEMQKNEQNYTSVRDTGELLESIYRGNCVGLMSNNQYMMDLLKAQERRWKIPEGIPADIVVANKTGELTDTENDAAIVFSPAGDYILCVMVSELSDTRTAQKQIVEVSRLVYEYFNT